MGETRGTSKPTRVLLADDHAMFRQGLAGILARYGAMEIVAEVPNDEDALRLARRLAPDVVVMQVQMPVERARETLEAMRAFPDPPRVVIVTMLESPRHVRALVGAKANAYLLKSDSAEHLIATVRAAVLDPYGADAVVGKGAHGDRPPTGGPRTFTDVAHVPYDRHVSVQGVPPEYVSKGA